MCLRSTGIEAKASPYTGKPRAYHRNCQQESLPAPANKKPAAANLAAAGLPGVWSLFRHVALGHQLVAHDGQHVLERRQFLGREPLMDARHHRVDVALHEAVVAVELVRQLQVVFAPVGVGVLLDDVALADEAVDLIGRVGLRDAEKIRKLTFKERQEMQQLESDMEKLNTEKTELETALNSGTLDTDELVRSSQRIAEIIDLLDEKEMRWLELSEIE